MVNTGRKIAEMRSVRRTAQSVIDQNLEQILEQRRILASLVGREADLVAEFLEVLLSAREMYISDRERLLRGSCC